MMNIRECRPDSMQQLDLEEIAESELDFEQYKNARVFITGATGLVGSYLVKTFLCCNRIKKMNMKVIAAVRNIEKAKELYGELLDRKDLELYICDVASPVLYGEDIDYIFHTASVTESKMMVQHPVRTIETAYQGTKHILDLAKNKKVKGMIYVSSMEVYGIPDSNMQKVTEENLGYIDITKARSSYSEGKRICECLCNAYVLEYHVPVKIARLAQTFGAGVLKTDTRVYSQFAKSVIQQKDIVLHSSGESEGNYCYIREAVEALLLLAYKGEAGEAYNVVNEENHMQIREMAALVAEKVADGKIQVLYDIPENELIYGYAPPVKMKLSSDKLRKLGWNPTVNLEETYKRMIIDLRQEMENAKN